MNPKYPVYIPTKGRWDSRLTIKALEKINVPYYIVIEPHQLKYYKQFVNDQKILLLPWDKPGDNTQLVNARNWIIDHSISNGHNKHWQIDDNISEFYRLHNNIKYRCYSGTIFKVMEDFTDRYTNISISGPNYELLVPRIYKCPPFRMNTRIYSCYLINNEAGYKFRGIYNDDTDLCIRMLKDGWCSILFNAFLCNKMGTMRVKGGNTPIYQEDGRLKMAQSLYEQHPDVTKVTKKWGRWQHQVDYSPFKKNKLIKKPGVHIPQGINNYGMVLKEIEHD